MNNIIYLNVLIFTISLGLDYFKGITGNNHCCLQDVHTFVVIVENISIEYLIVIIKVFERSKLNNKTSKKKKPTPNNMVIFS